MKIFYDVKKRRIIIRSVIVIISLFSIVMIIKASITTPSVNPTLASDTDTRNSTDVSGQNTANKPVDNSKSSTSTVTPIPTSGKATASTFADTTNKTAVHTSTSVISPAPTKDVKPTVANITKPTPTKNVKPTAANITKPAPTKAMTPTAANITKPTPTKAAKPTVKNGPAPIVTKTNNPTPKATNTKSSVELQVMYFNGNSSTTANTINPMFKLINNGNTDINLSDVKIRYYFTVDSDIRQNFWCDWCTAGTSNVFGSFNKLSSAISNADHYLEVGFSRESGLIHPGKSIEVQTRFSKDNWTDYSQSNDYSFNPSKGYTLSNKITIYINGKLIFGKEPL